MFRLGGRRSGIVILAGCHTRWTVSRWCHAVDISLRPAAVMKSGGEASSDRTFQNDRGLFRSHVGLARREPMDRVALRHRLAGARE